MCRIYRQTDLNPFRSGSVPHVLLHWALCFFFPSSSYNRYQTHTHTHTWMAAPPAVVRRDGSAERTISGCWTNPQSNRRFLFFLSFFYSFFFFVFVLTATKKSLISSTTQTWMAEHVVVPRWCHQWAVHRWFNFTRLLASRHQSHYYTTTTTSPPTTTTSTTITTSTNNTTNNNNDKEEDKMTKISQNVVCWFEENLWISMLAF